MWLDPAMTSPYAFFQFWVNADDRDVATYLKVFSFRSREEIEALEKAVAERPAAREAQRALAEELTALVHGDAQRDAVVAASQALFGRGSLEDLDEATLTAALAELPQVVVAAPAGARRCRLWSTCWPPPGWRRAATRAPDDRRGRGLPEQRQGGARGAVPGEGDLFTASGSCCGAGSGTRGGRRRKGKPI